MFRPLLISAFITLSGSIIGSVDATPVDYVKDWIAQQEKMTQPPEWQGGWERWAQGQIALFKNDVDGIQVYTEQRIYKNDPKEAVDLDFRAPGQNQKDVYVELKCYSQINDDTANTFAKNMHDDFNKIRKPLKAGLQGSTLWAIGISQKQFRDGILEAVKNIAAQDPAFAMGQLVTVEAQGLTGGRGTFDIWGWSYVNNNV